MVSPQRAGTAEPGLRQRQKARRRAEIIAAGKVLILNQGYAETSMEAIAEKAEVGVATVYNYFGSKGGLFADIIRPDFEAMYQCGVKLLAALPEDPVTGVLSLIEIYQKFQNNWDKKDALLAIIGPGLSAEPILDELAAYTEAQLKRQIKDVILAYQKRDMIRSTIDVTDAATIIFFIFNQHFIEYVTNVNADYGCMKQEMDRQISFLVSVLRHYTSVKEV